MAFKHKCPECKGILNLQDNLRGKRVRCSKCQEVFTVPKADDDEGEEDLVPSQAAEEAIQTQPRNSKTGVRSSRRRDEEEDEEDRPRSRRRDDDEEEDRPRRRKRAAEKSSTTFWLLVGGGAGLLLIVIAVVVI